MITIEDTIQIKTTPEEIFNFFIHIEANYKAWHPDHVVARWGKGKPLEEGSIEYFEEYLHGKLHKGKLRCTKVETNRRIEYRPLFPWSIFFPKGSFTITPKGESCIFTATASLRIGPLFLILAKKNLEAVRKHMKEEGENLKRILEKGED